MQKLATTTLGTRYLLTYPPDTLSKDRNARPYPENMMDKTTILESWNEVVDSFHVEEDDEETEFMPRFVPDTTIIHDYIGETDLEMTQRAERRETILRGREAHQLDERGLREWMRTKSCTRSDDGHMTGLGRQQRKIDPI